MTFLESFRGPTNVLQVLGEDNETPDGSWIDVLKGWFCCCCGGTNQTDHSVAQGEGRRASNASIQNQPDRAVAQGQGMGASNASIQNQPDRSVAQGEGMVASNASIQNQISRSEAMGVSDDFCQLTNKGAAQLRKVSQQGRTPLIVEQDVVEEEEAEPDVEIGSELANHGFEEMEDTGEKRSAADYEDKKRDALDQNPSRN